MLSKRIHLAAAVLVCALLAANGRQPSAVVNGLQMSVSHDDDALGSDKALRFAVKFYNTLSQKMTFAPGTTYSCGQEGSKTDRIRVTLTEASGAPHRHLTFLGSGPPYQGLWACGGRIDFFEVTLNPGEFITLPLDLTKYLDLSNSKQYAQAHFPAGTYTLQMELSGPEIQYDDGRPTPPGVGVGTVTSNILQIHFDKEFAAAVSDLPK
jgi:hypothetical protein